MAVSEEDVKQVFGRGDKVGGWRRWNDTNNQNQQATAQSHWPELEPPPRADQKELIMRIPYSIKRRIDDFRDRFNPDAVTLFGIHTAELVQTAVAHPEQWSNFHSAISIGMGVTVAKVLFKKP